MIVTFPEINHSSPGDKLQRRIKYEHQALYNSDENASL